MLDITKLVDLNKILAANSFTLVKFYTESCPPCIKIAPYLEKLVEELQHIAFVKVDCGNQNDIGPAYKVGAVPTFIFFKHGKAVHTHHGANEKELRDAISKHFE